MNCPKCGQLLDPGAVFCGNCGQPMAVSQALQPTPPVVSPVGVPAPAPLQGPVLPGSVPPVAPVAPLPQSFGVPVVTGAPTPMPMVPAYAAPGLDHRHPGEKQAIIGLVLAVLSMPGALIPIVGFVFSIAAVVLASLTLRLRKTLAVLALVFAGIGLILSILVVIYNIKHLNAPSTKLSSTTQSVDTICYSAELSKDLKITKAGGNCDLKALNASTAAASSVGYIISGTSSPTVTESNFAAGAANNAQALLDAMSQSDEVFTIQRQQSDTFGGKPAYVISADSDKGRSVDIALVLNSAPNNQNLFFIANITLGGDASLESLADSFVWK